ncbi:PRKR-interacting protein 1 like protein [Dufourea novaeangliae]|uniref:PRKR-interacting protein 1 like protein n=1 Tax=Dufourea novaeangliae TaxID=178035 RepID=A0A154P9J8_DUFNO|nr:PRKR-interacting protein 1 like protein [Dufourea novaeangliae]
MSETKEKEEEKPVVAKSAIDLQRLKLQKLMKNPEKPILLPERPKVKSTPTVPEFVRNVMGSSAGAGSGEFHVYRHLRRKEYARQKFIQEKGRKELLDDEYHRKLEENKRVAEEITAKKRAKRQKKKQKWKQKKQLKVSNDRPNKSDNSDSEEESLDEQDTNDKNDNVSEVVSDEAIKNSIVVEHKPETSNDKNLDKDYINQNKLHLQNNSNTKNDDSEIIHINDESITECKTSVNNNEENVSTNADSTLLNSE